MIEFSFRIIRARRRTLAVIVADGEVTVRAPLRVTDEQIGRFVESKRDWIGRQLAQRDPRFDTVREGREILCAGELFPVFFGARCNEEKDGAFFFKNVQAVHPCFIRRFGAALKEETAELSRIAGVCPKEILLRDFKARWGSCDAAGVIKLNWRLAMLPPRLCTYVMIHELCHLKHLDHSAAFWSEVKKLCPDYFALRKELKGYAFLTRCFRA